MHAHITFSWGLLTLKCSIPFSSFVICREKKIEFLYLASITFVMCSMEDEGEEEGKRINNNTINAFGREVDWMKFSDFILFWKWHKAGNRPSGTLVVYCLCFQFRSIFLLTPEPREHKQKGNSECMCVCVCIFNNAKIWIVLFLANRNLIACPRI